MKKFFRGMKWKKSRPTSEKELPKRGKRGDNLRASFFPGVNSQVGKVKKGKKERYIAGEKVGTLLTSSRTAKRIP